MNLQKWQSICECGATKTKRAKMCRACMTKQSGGYSRRKTMDRDEGLAEHQKHGVSKTYEEIKANANIKWNGIYKDNKNLVWN